MNARKVQKYYEALKTLHSLLSHTDKMSTHKFAKRHKVNQKMMSILVKGGIIKKSGKSSGTSWAWVGKPPTVSMARELYARLQKEVNGNKKPSVKKTEVKRKVKTDGRVNNGGRRPGAGRKPKAKVTADAVNVPVKAPVKAKRKYTKRNKEEPTLKAWEVKLGFIKLKVTPVYA